MGSNQSQGRIMYHETNFDQSQSIKETAINLKTHRRIHHLSIILQEMTTQEQMSKRPQHKNRTTQNKF